MFDGRGDVKRTGSSAPYQRLMKASARRWRLRARAFGQQRGRVQRLECAQQGRDWWRLITYRVSPLQALRGFCCSSH